MRGCVECCVWPLLFEPEAAAGQGVVKELWGGALLVVWFRLMCLWLLWLLLFGLWWLLL